MIDLGFLAGYALGCICTAALFLLVRKLSTRQDITTEIGAAAHSEVADLMVSTGRFVSSVRSLKRQVDVAHEALLRAAR